MKRSLGSLGVLFLLTPVVIHGCGGQVAQCVSDTCAAQAGSSQDAAADATGMSDAEVPSNAEPDANGLDARSTTPGVNGDGVLEGLSVFPGELSPTFSSATVIYSVEMPWYGTFYLSLVPEVGDGVSVRIDGTQVTSGEQILRPVPNSPSVRSIAVEVTGPSGASSLYEIDATRAREEAINLRSESAENATRFGQALVMDGDTLVVSKASGGIDIFRFDGADWVKEAALTMPTDVRGVAVDGDMVVVGDREEVRTFTRDGSGEWVTEAVLPSPVAPSSEWFGYGVALEGPLLAVGAPREEGSLPGSVYLFERVGEAWSLLTTIADTSSIDFGRTLAMDGDTLAVATDRNDGMVRIYTGEGSNWDWQASLEASTVSSDDSYFGYSLALDGDDLIVGAPYLNGEDSQERQLGEAYVFRRSGTTWVEQAVLKPDSSEGNSNYEFGAAVALDDGVVLVGAPAQELSGKVHVFARQADSLVRLSSFVSPEEGNLGRFGTSVGLQGGVFAIGMPEQPSADVANGGVWVFR